MTTLSLFTIADYILSLRLINNKTLLRWVCILSVIIAHSYLLYSEIDLQTGHNLSYINICSFVGWLSFVIINIFSFFFHVKNLQLIFGSFNVFIIFLSFFYNNYNLYNEISSYELVHIIIGLTSMTLLIISSVQAILLMLKKNFLKKHYTNDLLPPLESMEKFLLHILWFSFVSLSLMLTLATITLKEQFLDISQFKIIFSLAAWVILFVAIFNKYTRGWRGLFATKMILLSAFLLLIGYFGTR